MLKAIETRYKGYRFRSRLEARWAVFFEALGLDWKYEAQGFDVGGRSYLPDFELTDPRGGITYVEVKGDPDGIASNRYECQRYADFVNGHNAQLLLLGDIPRPDIETACHPIITIEQGLLYREWLFFCNKEAPFDVARKGGLSTLCGLHPVFGKDACDPDVWVVETKIIQLPRYVPAVSEAYEKARSARFEHGESPL